MNTCDVPLLERLDSVPLNARVLWDREEGGTRSIPVGNFCHLAAKEIRHLRSIESSAPELLAALEAAWMALGGVVRRNECIQNAMEKCQEAIAKARGEKLP